MKNSKRKNPLVKKLQKENWELCHLIVDKRDGRKCQIPTCNRTENLDLDHGISRNNKTIFFDVRHLGYLCRGIGGHHPAKSFAKNGPVAKQVDLIHIEREGMDVWNDLLEMARQNCHDFGKVWYQEKINQELKQQLEGVVR